MKKITLILMVFFFTLFSWQGFAQLTEDFEVDPPSGWTFMSTETDDPGFVQTDTQAHGGTYSFYHNDDNVVAESTSYMISPAYTVLTGDELKFWFYQNWSESFYVYTGVWISTASNDPIANPGDFVELQEFGSGTSEDQWSELVFDLSSYVGQTVYVAFKYTGDFSSELFIDDFSIAPAPSCPDAANLTAANFTAPGNADFSWDNVAAASNYNWEIQPQGTPQGTMPAVDMGVVNTNMVSTTALTDGSDYTLYVQTDCDTNGTGNYVSLDFSFTIPPVNDTCAGVIDLGAEVSPLSGTNVGAAADFAGLDCLTNTGAKDVVYSIVVPDGYTLDIGQTVNSFDSKHRLAYGGSCPGDTLVACTDDPDVQTETFVNTTGASVTAYFVISSFSTASGTFDLAWTLTAPAPCPDAVNLVANNFTAPGNADFSWDNVAAASNYNWEIQPQGTPQGTMPAVDMGVVNTNMVSTTALTDGSDYTLYVQTDCDTNGTGNYVSLDFSFIIPPVNDNITGAIPITPSPAGTGCTTFNFTAKGVSDGTTDSGLDGSCNTTNTGLDRFYSWTATTDALIFNDGDGNPGIVIRDSAGNEITCEGTFAAPDVELSGWAIGDDLIIQIYDYATADVEVTFCLEEFMLPVACSVPSAMVDANLGETSVDLSWTAGGTETMWEVVYDVDPYAQPANGMADASAEPNYTHVTATTLSLSGLIQNTIYNVYYRAHCGGTDYSDWASYSFTTSSGPQAPVNDNLCDAIAITVDNPSAGDAFTSELATVEAGEVEGSCFNGGINGSVWFTFVAPAGGEVIVTTDIAGGTHTDTEIAVYEAPADCTDASTIGAEVGCDQDSGEIINYNSVLNLTGLTPGDTYYIQVDRWGTASDGTFGIEVNLPPACPDVANLTANNFIAPDLADFSWDAAATATGYNWEVQPIGVAQGTAGEIASGSNTTESVTGVAGFTDGSQYTLYVQSDCGGGVLGDWFSLDFLFVLTPDNDVCANPVALTVGTSRDQNQMYGTNISTTDSGEVIPSCADYAGGDLWYSAVIPANGNLTIETLPYNGGGGDGGLAVYSGTCGNLTELDCNDDDGEGLFGFIQLTGQTPGDTVLIRVWEYGNNAELHFNVVAYSPDCPDLSNLVANNFTAPDMADFSWDAVAADGYNWEVQPIGVAQGTAGAIASGSSTTEFVTGVTGFTDDSDYTLYVQSDCGVSGLGNWFSLDFTFALPPANDTISGAIPIVPSAEGTACDSSAPTFIAHLQGDGTTDSGLDGTCMGASTGLDNFYTWTATSNGLIFSGIGGNPGIIIRDAATGDEITCTDTFVTDEVLSGWAIGDDLIIQVYDFVGADVDVTFCLAEYTLPPAADCPTLTAPVDGAIDLPSAAAFDLTWDAPTTGGTVDSYTVYGGTDPAALNLIQSGITDTFLPVNVGGSDLLTIYWQVVAVNGAGESVGCTIWSFTTSDGSADYDGDGIINELEDDPDQDGFSYDATDIHNPCDPMQSPGYTGYDSTNTVWRDADCDGDGQTNGYEADGGSDPYDNNSVISVGDLEAVGFSYYPNPVTHNLTLKANESINTISVFNMLGQEVIFARPSALETSLNMSNLASGTYFVKAQVGNAVGTFKVVKE